jgi:hypothetical protein
MDISYFTQTPSGEDKFHRWVTVPLPDVSGDPLELRFKIPSRLELFEDWKSCIKQETAHLLLDKLVKDDDPAAAYLTVFMQLITNPAIVDLMKLAERCGAKYVETWRGVKDASGNVVKFEWIFFKEKVLPGIVEWLINTVTQLALQAELQTDAEKKI